MLGSDFYAGYNIHQGLHQRCWVHVLRDAHDLKEKHPHDEQLLSWATSVKAIYDEAVAWVADGPDQNASPRQQGLARVAQQHAMPSSDASGSCFSPLCARQRLSIPYASASNAFCRNSLSLSRFLAFQHTTIWRSAVFAHLSLPARSVEEPAVPKSLRPVWDLPLSLAPGWHSTSTLSINVWLPSL